MKKILLATALFTALLSPLSASASCCEIYQVPYDSESFDTESVLPFVAVHEFVKNLYPNIPENQIIADLIDSDVWQVSIILSSSTKVFTVVLKEMASRFIVI